MCMDSNNLRGVVTGYEHFTEPRQFQSGLGSVKEAGQYFEWFKQLIPCRLEQLKYYVANHAPIGVVLDLTPGSLRDLGRLMDRTVSTRTLSLDEVAANQATFPAWVHQCLPDWSLTAETLSVALDIGIYFGEVLRSQHDVLRWDFVRKPKRNADLYLPVLIPFSGFGHFNPLRISVNVAFGVVSGQQAEVRLPQLYEFWAGYVSPVVPSIQGTVTG